MRARPRACRETFARRGAEEEFALVLDTARRWVGERLAPRGRGGGPRALRLSWRYVTRSRASAREIEIYNLDRRPLVLALFDDLAAAIRRTS